MDAPGLNDLAPEERALFQGSILDISGASEFYKRRGRIALQLREDVRKVSEDQYELSSRLLDSIIAVRHLLDGTEKMRPADALARTLFDCARTLAFTSSFLTERPKAEAWSEYFAAVEKHGPVRLRAEQRVLRVPVRSDGTLLEPFSRPDLPELRIHFAFNTEQASFLYGEDNGSYEIPERIENTSPPEERREYLEFFVQRLPELSIKIEGAPVTKMMIATFDRSGADTDLARACTLKMLNGLMHELKRFLGMVSKRGRPRLGIGEKAALLLDHEGKNIVQAVAELCPEQSQTAHSHSKRCQDRVRLAADQYYKSVEREFSRYLPAKARKT